MGSTSPPRAAPLGTVLVIGGAGFLGSNVVDQLLNFPSEDNLPPPSSQSTEPSSVVITSSHRFPSLRSRYPSYSPQHTKVHALDLRPPLHPYQGCTYHTADITSGPQLESLFSTINPNIIINTASPHFDAPTAILRKVNIEGTRTLLAAARATPSVKLFVHTSSSSVVHDCESNLFGADESYPYVCPNPKEYYSETKVFAERFVLEANEPANDFYTCAVRPAGIIGEGDKSGIAHSMSHQAATAPDWMLKVQLGDNENLFDCTYVGNVAYGLLCAAQALNAQRLRKTEGKADVLDAERVDGEAFNVTNSEPLPFWDIGRFIWSRYGRKVQVGNEWVVPRALAVSFGGASEVVSWVTGRKGRLTRQTAKYTCMHRWFSCEKLQRRTGYEAKVGVEEALERTVRWFKEDAERQKGKEEMNVQ